MKKIRCAIYTRKSSEDGLEQEFNSLDAQYEACAAYIASQKAEGWVLLPERYDDGGISGGTMKRPGLQRLLADIDRGAVDQILVYKIDRLTRSLADFAKMVDRLDAAGTSFVSVTQSFNTATSMGRLTLNMLLSFAQFEREVTAERIRDKIAASKQKGLWMGATVPLGYAADGRSLKIAEPDADVIRTIYDLYLQHRNVRLVTEAVDARGLKTPVRTLISGRIFDQTGDRLTPSHSKSAKGQRLRYYVPHRLVRGSAPRDPSGWRLPAPELEEKVAALIGQHMKRPEFQAGVLHEATTDEIATIGDKLAPPKESGNAATEGSSGTALDLVERIDISPGEVRISMSAEHLAERIGVDANRIVEEHLSFSSPFQHRKRGVETKLIIGNEAAETDETLLRNIARAYRYFDLVHSGKTFGEISEAEGVSKRRIQHLIELAFLAPDIIRSVHEGKQPTGLTSEWLKRHAFSPIWSEQREQFIAL